MGKSANEVPVSSENTYDQGKGQDAGCDVKPGPAYKGGALKDNGAPPKR